MILAAGSASAETAIGIGNFDWRPVMDAIMHVESKGNAKAVNGPHAGILQISKGIVPIAPQCKQQYRKSHSYVARWSELQ